MSLSTFAAAQLLRALPRVRISRAVGRLCERELPSKVSAPLLSAYCRAYGVNLAEAEQGQAGYSSFDAFFTRTLRDGARRISRDALVSPSDGRLSGVNREASNRGRNRSAKSRNWTTPKLTGRS